MAFKDAPDLVIQCVESMTDPTLRQERLEWIGSNWLNQDEAAASNWIQNSSLPVEVKTRLLKSPR
jgi:hypothetical protein